MFRSEQEFVKWLRRIVPRVNGRLRVGIGDDAAVVGVSSGHDVILTTDLTAENVHFTRALHTPRSVGHRALARSLSDIAAMGGEPRYALLSLALNRATTQRWVRSLYAAVSAMAKRFGVAVIGGDTTIVSGQILIDVILCGEVHRGRELRRSGARQGDQIFVSGRLGLSSQGLQLLKSRGDQIGKTDAEKQAISAHLYPEPQCALGRYLSRERIASAVIDISDGLSTDLHRLCEASRIGARIWESLIPGPSRPASGRFSQSRLLEFALNGGEDYQLLFTVPPAKLPKVPRRHGNVPLHRIGEVIGSRKVTLVRTTGKEEVLLPAGWDHFRKL